MIFDLLAYALAAILGVFGGWMFWGSRARATVNESASSGEGDPPVASVSTSLYARARLWRDSLSVPTALVLGLSSLVVAYHLLAWTLPSDRLPTLIPLARWWALVALVGAMVVGSVWADRLESRRGE